MQTELLPLTCPPSPKEPDAFFFLGLQGSIRCDTVVVLCHGFQLLLTDPLSSRELESITKCQLCLQKVC